MFGIGFTEILMILGVALIIIGPKNLPDLAKSLAKGYVEFMRAFREMQRTIEEDVSDIQKTLDPTTVIFDDDEPKSREDKTKHDKTDYFGESRESGKKQE